MRTPKFWYVEERFRDWLFTKLLTPLSYVYYFFAKELAKRKTPYKPKAPVICVGNIVAGGSGKTPTVIAIVEYLKSKGKTPHIISRGYGGTTRKLTKVDHTVHDAFTVGDEPFMMAKAGLDVWVGKDRRKSAYAAVKKGADVIIMDDGHQNNDLIKTLNLVVVDGLVGFGNHHLIPAGPLREPIKDGLSRADAVIMINEDLTGAKTNIDIPVIDALFVPTENTIEGARVYAFAGLGRPEKFLRTLIEMGADITDFDDFPDHYNYRSIDIDTILNAAKNKQATPVTTRKDFVRIPEELNSDIVVVDVTLSFDNQKILNDILTPILKK